MNSIILAAGNQTRFEDVLPKALVKIKDETLLDFNIKNLYPYSDTIIIICSKNNYKYFKSFKSIYEKVEIIKVDAGGGTGASLFRAKKILLSKYKSDNYILMWSDTANTHKNILEELSSKNDTTFYIPVTIEDNPYVNVVSYDNKVLDILFKKLKDIIPDVGYHDLSIFKLPLYHLECLDPSLIDLSIVDDFNILYMYKNIFNKNFDIKSILYYNKDYSFNTKEEYNIMLKEIINDSNI